MRILLITPAAPFPAENGGMQRTNLLHRALSELGQVDTLWLRTTPLPSEADQQTLRDRFGLVAAPVLQSHGQLFPWRLVWPISQRWASRIANFSDQAGYWLRARPAIHEQTEQLIASNKYDLVVGRYLRSLAWAGVLDGRPAMVDVDDLESAMWTTRLANAHETGLRRWVTARSLPSLRRREAKLLAQCRHVWVAKARDTALIGHDRVSVLPNIPFAPLGKPEPVDVVTGFARDSKILMTVGMLNNAPTEQGIEEFLANSWGEIRRRVSEAEYHLVGSGCTEEMRGRWEAHPGVRVLGFVDDLAATYAGCAATVCPIPWGGGTNIKVVESMAYKRPSVVTPMAHRGWEDIFPAGKCVLVANSAEEFGSQCVRLLDDRALREEMGIQGRVAAKLHFSFDVFRKAVVNAVKQTMGNI